VQPKDSNAVVLNQALAAEMAVGVGDWITIDVPAKGESDWQVVGLVFEPLDQKGALLPRDTLLKEINQVGRGKAIKVKTLAGDATSERQAAEALRRLYEDAGYEVVATTTETTHEVTAQRTQQMSILIALLSSMAIMIAVVGAVALSGTLAINVMERTREIGVMRAIGASSLTVAIQFVGEGLILGWLSWLIAIPLSLPISRLVIYNLSRLMNIELIYQHAMTGVIYWLVIVTVLAFMASWFPAQKAAQTSVRESLAYV
jgi:putative ABC transport system permease protein